MMQAPAGPAEAQPLWTVVYSVASADDTVTAVAEAHGVVLQPGFDVPGARIAVLVDPTGATFRVMEHTPRS